jgi:hypothetical protein
MGSVTDNMTKIRFGYRIYSLWRFRAATQVTITVSTIALVASHFDDSVRALISSDSEADWRRLTSETDWRGLTPKANGCIVFSFQHRAGSNGNTDLLTVGYHAMQQYWSGERIYGTIAATVT